MSYVNAAELVRKAQAGHYAVGQFNISNLESIRTFLACAQETESPLILGVSGGTAAQLGGYRTIADTVKNMMAYDRISVPVCLHADHSSYTQALEALYSGFSSIMFDGSRLEFSENAEKTAFLSSLCHEKGASLEAEVGPVAGGEDGGERSGELADPEQCAAIAALGIDLLAAGIGNVHGAYPLDWKGLDFPLLDRIRAIVAPLPLVLHGGSGIPDAMVRSAIQHGIAKINVNSECREAFSRATRIFFQSGRDKEDPAFQQLITLRPGLAAIRQVCLSKMQLFGCLGKA